MNALVFFLALARGGFLESAPYWVVLAEEYSPVMAAAIAVVVLSRTGFTNKLNEYRRDTLGLVQLRAETLEKELSDAHADLEDMQRDLRSRDRRIEALEQEVEMLRYGTERPSRRPHRPAARETPPPLHAPDVDDPTGTES